MKTFIRLLNEPAKIFKEKHILLSFCLLLITIFGNSLFDQILSIIVNNNEFDILKFLKLTAYGFIGYFIFCIILFIITKLFGSKEKFSFILSQWALTMIPTFICAIVVSITETYYYYFWNDSIYGFCLNFVFGGILIWKFILYIIFLRNVAELKGSKLILFMIVIGIFIIILATFMAFMGLKTPII